MNILLINHYAGSPEYGMEFRPYYFSKNWVELGHNVTIFAASYSHLRYKQPFVKDGFQHYNKDNINYIFFNTISYLGNGFGRLINIFQFLFSVLINHKKTIINVPDVIIASSTYPLDFLIANYLAKYYQAKVVYEVHDLWPMSLKEIYGYRSINPFIFLLQLNENYNYRNTDYLISMLPFAKEYMVEHGLDSKKFNYIPNGFETEKVNNENKLPEILVSELEKIKKDGYKVIGYAGYHHTQNSLMCLINAAEIAVKDKIHFFLIGDGPDKSRLKKYVKMKSIKNVSFFQPVPKISVQELLSKFDYLYFGFVESKIYDHGIAPNKLLDYLMSGKPILQSGKAPNNIVKDINAGECVESNSPENIHGALIKLMKYDQFRLTEIESNSIAYVKKNHDFKVLAKNFLSIIANSN